MTDEPIIAYLNFLEDSVTNVTTGVENLASPMSNIWNTHTSRPALPTADGSGNLVVEFTLSLAAIAYGVGGYGMAGYGGVEVADTAIIGASRHRAIGERFPIGSTVKIEAFTTIWETVLDETMVYPVNKSVIYSLTEHASATKYRLSIGNLAANSTVPIPEMYIGASLVMPFVNLGFDPYREVVSGRRFTAESGTLYQDQQFKRVEPIPQWSNLTRDQWLQVDQFREYSLENFRRFWWSWRPDSLPHETYIVQNSSDVADMPFDRTGDIRTFTGLKLIEAI